MKYEKHCLMCDRVYEYCIKCSDFDHLPRWMTTFHSVECKKVFEIISDYKFGLATKEECKERLNDLDLKDIKFNTSVKKAINEISKTVNKRPKMKTPSKTQGGL